ncbi:MAG: hypothetical protein PVJ57_09210 [Phycisphaerae bacterium]|jgi:hypothetical protein
MRLLLTTTVLGALVAQAGILPSGDPSRQPAPGFSLPAPPADPPGDDYEQMLREGFELIDDGERQSAIRALQRAVLGAPDDTLAVLDRQCQAARGKPLPALLAELRILEALDARSFWIKYATPYEREALGRQLEERSEALLAVEYQGRSIRAWSAEPEAYETLCSDARQMVATARQVAGMIGVRLRLDPRLKDNREERKRLLDLRESVGKFVGRVIIMPGYTEPLSGEPDDPGAEAARHLDESKAPTSRPAKTEQKPPAGEP